MFRKLESPSSCSICLRPRLPGYLCYSARSPLTIFLRRYQAQLLCESTDEPYVRSVSMDCVECCIRQLSLRLLSGSTSLDTASLDTASPSCQALHELASASSCWSGPFSGVLVMQPPTPSTQHDDSAPRGGGFWVVDGCNLSVRLSNQSPLQVYSCM